MDGNEELKEKLLDHSMTREELLLEHTHTFIAEYSYKTGQLEIYPEDGHFVDFDRKSLDTDFEHAFYKTVFKRDLPLYQQLIDFSGVTHSVQRDANIRLYVVPHIYEWFRISVLYYIDEDGERDRIVLAFTNAEKELEAVHELKSLVTVDSLTQLPNINTFSMQTWELLKNHPEREYADRMSVNLELPTADGLKTLAPHKSRKNILTPMRQLQRGIHASQLALGIQEPSHGLLSENAPVKTNLSHGTGVLSASGYQPPQRSLQRQQPRFVPAGQSTQMIIGATKETDYHIVTVAEALYHNYDLKRVFYSAFVNVNHDEALPAQPDGKGVPLLREHRLYQADWLMRFYGFHSGELLSEEKPNFNVLLDPKCDWAIRHLEQFPVEINRADYYTLLRVPGIGVRSAQRIVKARRSARLDFKDIKKMGVVLKRALYFITCSGRTLYPIRMNEDFITNRIIGVEALNRYQIEHHDSYRQLSLFDDFHMDTPSSDK